MVVDPGDGLEEARAGELAELVRADVEQVRDQAPVLVKEVA
ncbi:hypothetical protein [Streptomyces sp. NPDC051132]